MLHILTAAILTITLLGVAPASPVAIAASADVPSGEIEPVTTDNTFFPDNADLTDCLGTVERPGCGSKARGGWRQTLVFVAMIIGLLIVFGRVGLALYRNRNTSQPKSPLGQ